MIVNDKEVQLKVKLSLKHDFQYLFSCYSVKFYGIVVFNGMFQRNNERSSLVKNVLRDPETRYSGLMWLTVLMQRIQTQWLCFKIMNRSVKLVLGK